VIVIDEDVLRPDAMGRSGEVAIVICDDRAAALDALQRVATRARRVNGKGLELRGSGFDETTPNYADSSDTMSELGASMDVDCKSEIDVGQGETFVRILREELEAAGIEDAHVVTSHVGIWLRPEDAIEIGSVPSLAELIGLLPGLVEPDAVACLYEFPKSRSTLADAFENESRTIGCGWRDENFMRVRVRDIAELVAGAERGIAYTKGVAVYAGETMLLTALGQHGPLVRVHPAVSRQTIAALEALVARGEPVTISDPRLMQIDPTTASATAAIVRDGRQVGDAHPIAITIDAVAGVAHTHLPGPFIAGARFWLPPSRVEIPLEGVNARQRVRIDWLTFKDGQALDGWSLMARWGMKTRAAAEGGYVVIPLPSAMGSAAAPSEGVVMRIDVAGQRVWWPPERALEGDGFEEARRAMSPRDGSPQDESPRDESPAQTAITNWIRGNIEQRSLSSLDTSVQLDGAETLTSIEVSHLLDIDVHAAPLLPNDVWKAGHLVVGVFSDNGEMAFGHTFRPLQGQFRARVMTLNPFPFQRADGTPFIFYSAPVPDDVAHTTLLLAPGQEIAPPVVGGEWFWVMARPADPWRPFVVLGRDDAGEIIFRLPTDEG
jgi:hypothetical protein